ncbi:hypothetical protein RSOLAG22IIIB_13403 [Rhizoctonia solani]|uniref:Intradiol ring-cleavage dioxygenases domain-containing protein n=1 Tax=Rhizoctonia solani TaxID=456999 RepID=A0A0K6FM78_9AGAM|nr:hypothetical protein RSOLAG22IIIB_13403 [Rhizoctonia solani]
MLPKTLSIFALGLIAVACITSGKLTHPRSLPRAELGRHQLEANKRHLRARNCASQIADFDAKRKAKRGLVERNKPAAPDGHRPRRQDQSGATSSAPTAHSPTYATIQNSTCVAAPEVNEGPYFINNEHLRQDISEDQDGVPLVLDIGVMDVTTCQPLEQALVEIWHCNATGQYSGFTTAKLDPRSGNAPTGGNNPVPFNSTTSTGAGSTKTTLTGVRGRRVPGMTDQLTFLRGGWATDSEGMVEFKSIYPGYYSGRAVHIHAMVQTNYSVAANGSIISHAGSLRHIGQLFFDDSLSDKIVTQGVYANTTQRRVYNSKDGIMDDQNADGYNAIVSTELLGESETDGILAYITIGIDPTFVGSITSTNYVNLDL